MPGDASKGVDNQARLSVPGGFLVNGARDIIASQARNHLDCLLAADKRVQRAVMAELQQNRPAIRRDLKAGRLLVAEYRASAAAQLEYWRAQMSAALKTGALRLYVVGDLSAGALSRLPFPETLAYEAEYGRSIAQAFPVTTLCQYDARKISGVDAAAILQCHDGPLH